MPKAEPITSAVNPLLKQGRRAIARGGVTGDGLCVAETFHLLEEAVRSPCEIEAVLAAESAAPAAEALIRRAATTRLLVLDDRLFQGLAATETSQGVIALVKPPAWNAAQLFSPEPLIVILDTLQDPGNAGTIARTAEAFGATGILFLKGTVNPFNPKTLRASAGSLFRIPFLHSLEAAQAQSMLEQNGVRVCAAVPTRPERPAPPPAVVDLTGRCGFVIGSEGRGVSEEMRATALEISIPTVGVESLNAAVAAGILLYEAQRQRSREV